MSDDGNSRRPATPLEVAKAVASAFFGVRKREDHVGVRLTPLQLIVAGIVGAALFIATLLLIVQLVLSRA